MGKTLETTVRNDGSPCRDLTVLLVLRRGAVRLNELLENSLRRVEAI